MTNQESSHSGPIRFLQMVLLSCFMLLFHARGKNGMIEERMKEASFFGEIDKRSTRKKNGVEGKEASLLFSFLYTINDTNKITNFVIFLLRDSGYFFLFHYTLSVTQKKSPSNLTL